MFARTVRPDVARPRPPPGPPDERSPSPADRAGHPSSSRSCSPPCASRPARTPRSPGSTSAPHPPTVQRVVANMSSAGTAVYIDCYTRGQSIYGQTIWYRITRPTGATSPPTTSARTAATWSTAPADRYRRRPAGPSGSRHQRDRSRTFARPLRVRRVGRQTPALSSADGRESNVDVLRGPLPESATSGHVLRAGVPSPRRRCRRTAGPSGARRGAVAGRRTCDVVDPVGPCSAW